MRGKEENIFFIMFRGMLSMGDEEKELMKLDRFSLNVFKTDTVLNFLEKVYFCENGYKMYGIKNKVSREYEDKIIVEKYLKEGKIDEIVVCWKTGQLNKVDDKTYECIVNNEEYYLSGYGTPIIKNDVDCYIYKINADKKLSELFERINKTKVCSDNYYELFKDIYSKLLELQGEVCKDKKIKYIKNFGTVYIINLIYFLSKGNFPIYDKFVHKALKALHLGLKPCEVYVGGAPDKHDIDNVVNMYREYVCLIEKTITMDKYKKSRKADRALWAYGHKKN